MQSRVTAFWPDGSVKWTAHTADAGKLSEVIEVVPADGGCQRKGELEVEVKRLEGQRIITAGSVAVVIPDEGKWLFEMCIRDSMITVKKEAPYKHREYAGYKGLFLCEKTGR